MLEFDYISVLELENDTLDPVFGFICIIVWPVNFLNKIDATI